MSKTIGYSDDARQQMFKGIQTIAKAVKSTLGPSGKNVLIRNHSDSKPFVTKDGVTVAGQITSDNYFEQIAIELIQDIANSSDAVAGDGTTTATILAEAMFEIGLDVLKENPDINLIALNNGLQKASKKVIAMLEDIKIECKDEKDLYNVALISSNGDQEISQIVIDAYKVSGNQGVVNIKRSHTYDTYLTSVKGFVLDTGYRSRAYVNNEENDTVEFKNALVYFSNTKIDKVSDNLNYLLTYCSEEQIPLLIICKDMDQPISEILIKNKFAGTIKVCVCKAPGFGQEQIDDLEDLGVFLNQEPFLENSEITFDGLDPEDIFNHLPVVKEVVVTANNIAFSELKESEDVLKHVEQQKQIKADKLRGELKNKQTSYEKSLLQTRISKLSEGIAYVHIGAKNDLEFTEKQHRIQDCLYAVKAAKEEGILPGGGNALLFVAHYFNKIIPQNKIEKCVNKILAYSLSEPFHRILDNAGIEFKEKSDEFEFYCLKHSEGYDATTGKIVHLVKAGIIDPFKVVKTSFTSASSIIGLLLSTECVIIDNECYEKQKRDIFL